MTRDIANDDMLSNRGVNAEEDAETAINYWVGARVKNGYRLCLGCLESWTFSTDPLCPACKIEHELHRNAKGDWGGKPEPSEWWGPTLKDVDPEDLENAYYGSSAWQGDFQLRREDYDDEER